VPYSREQKDKYGICGANKKNGDKCRNFAGLGTPHLGVATLQLSAGQMIWIQQTLKDQNDTNSFEGQVLFRMWGEERDRVARISEAVMRIGVQERAIRLPEFYGQTIAKLLEHVFEELELQFVFDEDDDGINPEVRGQIVRKAIMAVAPDSADRFEKLTLAAGEDEEANGDKPPSGKKDAKVETAA
jgi:hypothetical protein